MNSYETLTYDELARAMYDSVQKIKNPPLRLSMEAVRNLNYLTPDYAKYLNNQGLIIADMNFGPGKVLLQSMYDYSDNRYLILEVSWLNLTAPYQSDYWPLWAALPDAETKASRNSALLCATGKYFLNGGITP